MDREFCLCGSRYIEIIPFVYLCENEEHPHLWEGALNVMLTGIGDQNSLRMAQEILKLREALEDVEHTAWEKSENA